MPGDFIIRTTEDGSDTLYSASMHESYHSLNGAVQESLHVFIEAGLHPLNMKEIRIFEVGFGTGLNALLTWMDAAQSKSCITYDAIEAFPVNEDITSALNYHSRGALLPDDAYRRLHATAWNEAVWLEKDIFSLRKIHGNFIDYALDSKYDLVFFDAFAPDKQPEMWQESMFEKLFEAMNPGGILVTYCAKGEVRRCMQRAGFRVERLPGPPGKREMLRAVRM